MSCDGESRFARIVAPERRDGAPEALTAPTTSARRREQETHRTKQRILSDLGPACAAGAAGPEILEEDKLRAEHSDREKTSDNLPRFSLFSPANFRCTIGTTIHHKRHRDAEESNSKHKIRMILLLNSVLCH